MAARGVTATRYEICKKIIEYCFNEQSIIATLKGIPRCCSPIEGWNRLFVRTLKSQFSLKKLEIPDNICRRCVHTFIPTPKILSLQTQQEALKLEIFALRWSLPKLPETTYINFENQYFWWPLEPFDELVEQFICGSLTAFEFVEAVFDLFWELFEFDSHLLLAKIHLNSTPRRPPPRRRWRSCASVSNRKQQASLSCILRSHFYWPALSFSSRLSPGSCSSTKVCC